MTVTKRFLLGMVLLLTAVYLYKYEPDLLKTALPNKNSTILFYVALGILSLGCIVSGWSSSERIDPSNKAVFITGCDSGFGHQLSIELDKQGYTVFAGCLMPDREGAQLLKEVCSDKLHVVTLDVTNDWQVREATKYVREHLCDKVLWALVNNAGVAVFTEIEWCAVQQFERVMDVNVFGVVRVTKAFLPLIRAAKGRVINVASLAGRFTLPAFSAYSMSKKACIAFSDGLRLEMAKFDVKVITIEPGLYRTPISQETYLIDMNRKSWAETPTDVKNDYGEEYFESFLENISKQMKRARPNVQEVVKLMAEAVTSKYPRKRYVPYWWSNIRSQILMALPNSITDILFMTYMPKAPVEAKRRESEREDGTPK